MDSTIDQLIKINVSNSTNVDTNFDPKTDIITHDWYHSYHNTDIGIGINVSIDSQGFNNAVKFNLVSDY